MNDKERAKQILKILTPAEKDQFRQAVKEDFGCQWDGTWKAGKGVFEELFKILKHEKAS